jgi:rhodanese-related sulfurtransferase
MNRRLKVIMALGVLSAFSAFANCGTCGTGASECKDDAACGVGGSAVKADKAKACCPSEAKVGVVDTAGVEALLKGKTPVVVLDARSGKYDDGKRLPGAKSLNDKSSDEDIYKLLPDKKALLVTYCSGLKCPASGNLAAKLKKLGYENVLEYAEGMEGWLKAGKAVENAK